MSHGAPDYSNVSKEGLVYRVDDLGELAVRLGSIVTYERRGEVYWLTNFDNGLGDFESFISGTGSDIKLNNVKSEIGPYSIELVGGTQVGYYSQINKILAVPLSNTVGFQISIEHSSDSYVTQIDLTIYDGFTLYNGSVWIQASSQQIQLRDSDGNYFVLASSLGYLPNTQYFMHVKLVIDIVNNKYVRLLVDNVEYDLSAYGLASGGSSIKKSIQAKVTNYNDTGDASSIFVDNFIITINEWEGVIKVKESLKEELKLAVLNLVQDKTIIQGGLAVIIVITICYMYLNQIPVPEVLVGVLLLVLGFYFGGKVEKYTNGEK